MRADWIEEQKLEVDVPFNQIISGFGFSTVKEIGIFDADEFVEAVFDDISIDHGIVSSFNFLDLLFDLALEDSVEFGDLFVFVFFWSVIFLFFESFCHEHFKG